MILITITHGRVIPSATQPHTVLYTHTNSDNDNHSSPSLISFSLSLSFSEAQNILINDVYVWPELPNQIHRNVVKFCIDQKSNKMHANVQHEKRKFHITQPQESKRIIAINRHVLCVSDGQTTDWPVTAIGSAHTKFLLLLLLFIGIGAQKTKIINKR